MKTEFEIKIKNVYEKITEIEKELKYNRLPNSEHSKEVTQIL